MNLPEIGTIEVFIAIVDINGFTPIVSRSSMGQGIAQFVRDVLSGGIDAVERHGGVIAGFMGDAFLAVFDNVDSVYMSCVDAARDLDRQCEYISDQRRHFPEDWHYAKGGAGLKIGIEYGWIDISTIHSNLLGRQKFLIGPPINHACRIMSSGEGNRCHVGPKAMKRGLDQWRNSGPYLAPGKHGEGEYYFWTVDLSDIWKEGKIEEGEDTYWG